MIEIKTYKDPSAWCKGEWVVTASHPSQEFPVTDRFPAHKWSKRDAEDFMRRLHAHWEGSTGA